MQWIFVKVADGKNKAVDSYGNMFKSQVRPWVGNTLQDAFAAIWVGMWFRANGCCFFAKEEISGGSIQILVYPRSYSKMVALKAMLFLSKNYFWVVVKQVCVFFLCFE